MKEVSVKAPVWRICRVFLAAAMTVLCGWHAHAQTTLTISIAASLKDSMAEVEGSYRQLHPEVDFRNNFGSSGTLEMQIEQGAPVDVFLSAAAKPMDD